LPEYDVEELLNLIAAAGKSEVATALELKNTAKSVYVPGMLVKSIAEDPPDPTVELAIKVYVGVGIVAP
jgi:hypothetical protein